MWWKKKKKEIDEDYILREAKRVREEELNQILDRQEELEDKIYESKGLSKYWEIVKMMFSMLNDYRRGNYTQAPWLTIASLTVILLYILNPMDLIPDFIPIIGYLDDVTILALGLNMVESDLDKYMEWKARHDIKGK